MIQLRTKNQQLQLKEQKDVQINENNRLMTPKRRLQKAVASFHLMIQEYVLSYTIYT